MHGLGNIKVNFSGQLLKGKEVSKMLFVPLCASAVLLEEVSQSKAVCMPIYY